MSHVSDIFYLPGYFLRAFPRIQSINNRVLLDLMYLDGDPVSHIVSNGTNVSAARFLPHADTKSIWIALVMMWVSTYTGYPFNVHLDWGSAFKSIEWAQLCGDASITTTVSGTESHNFLG